MKRGFLMAAAVLTLGACATPPYGYAPASPFVETPIAADRYRISYRAERRMDEGRARDVALLRAADLAIQQGYDWFLVEQQYTEVVDGRGYGRGFGYGGNGPAISIGTSHTSFGRHSATGVGVGIGFNLGGGDYGYRRAPLETMLEVQFGRGATPIGAYDARDVQRTIRGRML